MKKFKEILNDQTLVESPDAYGSVVNDIKKDIDGNMKLLETAIKKAKEDPDKSEKAIGNFLTRLERMAKNLRSDLG